MIVVADTSPVLHLARVGHLDLIRATFGNVIVPRAVWAELVQHGTPDAVAEALRGAAWISVQDDPPPQELGLDAGETSAILLAKGLRADAILIDERRGRGVARGLGLVVVGTLGVLAGAKRLGAIERTAGIVEQLRAGGFWLADDVVADFLAAVGESR
jgi:predicted nucleic acid-binding protein